jgi:penicillin-insensitive murein endopeptidase
MRIMNFLLSGAVAMLLLVFVYAMYGSGLAPSDTLSPEPSPQAPSQVVEETPAAPVPAVPAPRPEESQAAAPVESSAAAITEAKAGQKDGWGTIQQVTMQVTPPTGRAPDPVSAAAASPAVESVSSQPAVTASIPSLAGPALKITKTSLAKDLFGAAKQPANLAAKSIGFYAHGCLAGGEPLPVNGPAWQVMRLSRNRNWGHPILIKYIERFAADAKEKDGWPGLLIGDLSMPRGGPMPFGHASHQVGLDVDIWYEPEPDHELTQEERESKKMASFLSDPGHVNPAVWKPDYEKLLRRAVSYPEVTRVFVNPAIKKWLCDNAKGDRSFMQKITPIMGHDDHFHVRLGCPPGSAGCENQVLKATDEGCGKGLDHWIEGLMKQKPAPAPAASAPQGAPAPHAAPAQTRIVLKGLAGVIQSWKRKAAALRSKRNLTMAQLPQECEAVLKAPPAHFTASMAAGPQLH